MGISDIIAGFIQQELDNAGGALELQRSDLAQRFNCVPIRITRVQVDRQTLLMHVINSVGSTLDSRSARAIAQNLVDGEAVSHELGQALLSATGPRALQAAPPECRDALRAAIFKQILIHSV